jgi:mRNA interferase RelE/StbE
LKVKYRKKFLKELAHIPSQFRSSIEKFVFKELPQIDSITDSRKIIKLQGYPNYYKVRFGSYRIGLKIDNDELILERVLHRKDIYRYFP